MNAIKKIFKDNLGLIISSAVIFVALMVIYSETLDGTKSFYGANDKISARNVKEAISKSEDYPYWFPWMMGGVPSVHSAQNISDYYPPNYVMKALHSIGVPWFWNYIFHFLFAGIGMYLLCSRLKLNSFASTLSGLGFAITPYMTGMLVHGHGSQVMTLCYMPWVFYAYIKLKDKPSVKRLALLSLFLALQLLRGHVQMAYYTWMTLGILILIDVIYQFFIKKDNKVKWLFYTALGLLLGFMSSLSLYIPMLSYTPFSTRSSGDGQGAGLDYVTEYSFSFGEIATFFIPSYYGFGEATYWGTMTFTSFPHYMSVVMLLFAIYGLIRYKWTRFKVFSISCILFFLTLSFGKNFIGFYEFFYNYLPFFSKLRNPAYLLIIVQFCTMILAGMGLSAILGDIKGRNKWVPMYSVSIFIFLCLSPIFIDFNSYAEEKYSKDLGEKILEDKKEIKILEKEILDLENKREREFQYIDDNAIGLNYSKQEIDDIKSDYSRQYDSAIDDRQMQIDYFSLDFKKINLTRSIIQTDIWIMQVFLSIMLIIIVGFYFGHPYMARFDNLNYIFLSLIGILVFLDFYFVDRRITNREKSEYLMSEDAGIKYKDFYDTLRPFTSRDRVAPLLKPSQDYTDTSNVVQQLLDKKNKGDIFRVIDQDGASNSNLWARYHIEDVRGYHPAKLKLYKDIFESDKGVSLYILSMMNVKYLIQGGNINLIPSQDRAYFVENLKIGERGEKDSRFEKLYLGSGSPSDTSYITSGEKDAPSGKFIITNTDTIDSINNSSPNELVIELSTSRPQFLAISEVFYPKGWKATINNEKVNIYEINDLIRGVYIDKKGSHTVRMWFDPSDLKWGKTFSYVGFLVILTLLFFRRLQNLVIQKRIK